MKAMILSAGRGKRMRCLTKSKPKPLLEVHGKALIEHQIKRLKEAGIKDIIINIGYLGSQIKDYLGNGEKYNINLTYSVEPQEGLETGGGVFKAIDILGQSPFILTNADLYTDYDYSSLLNKKYPNSNIHLILVDNPDFKKCGDFSLKNTVVQRGSTYTFSGISIINPKIFTNKKAGTYPISPIFHEQIDKGLVTGEIYKGMWYNVGTPEQLAFLNQ